MENIICHILDYYIENPKEYLSCLLLNKSIKNVLSEGIIYCKVKINLDKYNSSISNRLYNIRITNTKEKDFNKIHEILKKNFKNIKILYCFNNRLTGNIPIINGIKDYC